SRHHLNPCLCKESSSITVIPGGGRAESKALADRIRPRFHRHRRVTVRTGAARRGSWRPGRCENRVNRRIFGYRGPSGRHESADVVKSDEQWRELLEPLAFSVTRRGETERPFT